MSTTYPFVDVSRMLEYPKCAIHCKTEDEADALIFNMRSQHPSHASNFKGNNGWSANGPNTAYTLFYSGDKVPTNLSRTNIRWFRENGYEVIPFSELSVEQAEMEESDMPLISLLGL